MTTFQEEQSGFHIKLEEGFTFEMNTDFMIILKEVELFDEGLGDITGHVRFHTSIDPEHLDVCDIWFDEDGDHYICLPTNEEDEDGEPELQVMLIEDLLGMLNNQNV